MKQIFALALVLGLSTQAAASSFIDQRGFALCESTLTSEMRGTGLLLQRTHYVKQTEGERIYYINGHVWGENEEREAVRAICVTSANGRHLVRLETDQGRFVSRQDVAKR